MNPEQSFKYIGVNNDKAVLLLHGMTGSPYEMKQYGKILHKAGYNIYCPCLPGHGRNIKDIKQAKWNDWLNFALEQYDELKENYPEVYISGVCMGAVLALLVAEKRQDVSGVVSISTTLHLDGWTIPWYKFMMPVGLYTILRYYYSFPEREPYGIKNKTVRRKISAMLKENIIALDNIPMACVYELLGMSRHLRKNAKNITSPVLLIHSQEDDLTSVKSADYIYKNISSEIKEFIIFNNSYHLIVLDNDKDLAIEKSVEFLNKIGKSNKDDYLQPNISVFAQF